MEPFCFFLTVRVPLELGSPLSLLAEPVFEPFDRIDRLGSIWHRRHFFASRVLVLLDCLNPEPVKTICPFRKKNRHQNRHHRHLLLFCSLFV